MKQKPPSNSRPVLTYARDRQGIEVWQIDNFIIKPDIWSEAYVWKMEVLWWQNLPPKPDLEGE